MKKTKRILSNVLIYLCAPLLLVCAFRVFLCNFYYIPSDSMAPTILPGEFIMVEKLSYGTRFFTRSDSAKDSPSVFRISGVGKVQRNDVLAFNFPYRKNRNRISLNFDKIFVKRCVGLPGDSLLIQNGFYRIAGLQDTVGYLPEQRQLSLYAGEFSSAISRVFPKDSNFHWSIRNFGPLYIPAAGTSIELTPRNFKLFGRLMEYETKAKIRLKDSIVHINEQPATAYTFRYNWYFMAGDKVMNSQDSRYIGLVPEDFIIGKAAMVLTSRDTDSGKFRWNRLMKRIK